MTERPAERPAERPPESRTEQTAELPAVSATGPAAAESTPNRRARGLPLPFALVLGAVAWWPIAFLPWLLGRSAVLPLRNRLHVPVPLLANQAPLLITCVLFGGVLSAVLLRFCRGAVLGRVLLGLAGLLVVAVVVCALGGRSSRAIASDSVSQSRFVTIGLIAIILMVTGALWLVGLLALAGHTGWVVPVAVLAAVLPSWLSTLSGRDLSFGGWTGGILLGLVLGLGAARSAWALIWWVPGLVLGWFVGPVITAAVYSQQLIPTLSRRGDLFRQLLDDVLAPCLQVFGQASLPWNRPLWPWALALVVGIIGLIVGVAKHRSRRTDTTAARLP